MEEDMKLEATFEDSQDHVGGHRHEAALPGQTIDSVRTRMWV